MHDAAAQETGPLTGGGVSLHPDSTLADRAVEALRGGPLDSGGIARGVLGLHQATTFVADRVVTALLGSDPRVSRLRDGRWSVVPAGITSPVLSECDFAVVDVETTGSSPTMGHRVLEIAVVAVRGGEVDMLVDTVVNPRRPIPRRIMALTRITEREADGGPVFDEIADEVSRALDGRVFVAHNVGFDWRFVEAELKRARGYRLNGPRICTARLARPLVPGLRSRGLDSLARFFGIEIANRHRAGGDALATARLLLRLLDAAGDRGVETLDGLIALTHRRRKRRKKRSAMPQPMDDV